MEHYAGIDVSLEWSSICVVDALGQLKEAKISSEPTTHGYYSREAKAERSRVRAGILVLRSLRDSI